MSVVAILGAGGLGAAVAHKLAERERVREIRLVDEAAEVASGKALDLQQSGPIGGFDTRLVATSDPLTAAGADVVVVADAVEGGEWRDERGVALVARLLRAGARGPIVFAGPGQIDLLEACVSAGVPADRAVGSAAAAAVGAVQALVGAEIDGSGTDVSVGLGGRPPTFVVAWSSAMVGASAIGDIVAPHRLRAIEDALGRLWPPGPQAIAAATAPIVEALAGRSRRRHQALALTEGQYGARQTAAMLTLELGHGRILQRIEPTLSPQERTRVINGLKGT